MPCWAILAYGSPFLSGVGRLPIKDAIMLGAAVVTPGGICESQEWVK